MNVGSTIHETTRDVIAGTTASVPDPTSDILPSPPSTVGLDVPGSSSAKRDSGSVFTARWYPHHAQDERRKDRATIRE